jgi:hypothetical protein
MYYQTINEIENLVKFQLRRPLVEEEAVSLWLQVWWSKKYERPLKDPLLLEYTLEELMYEFFVSQEYEVVQKEKEDEKQAKIDKEKYDQGLAWAEEMEKQAMQSQQQWMEKEEASSEMFTPPEDLELNF